ncbi:DNA-3-methyladenine glycosylase family protein [Granulosicoccus sp. 3-233]|uniref:DNA-3-methyladenine glycosylase family protein n=1 Tax=Granulosicoccus sp. 3-233 TaxID=3417969 RepID=UPI003D3416BD
MTHALPSLTRDSLDHAIRILAERDPLMSSLLRQFGMPPMWQRSQNFSTLVHIVLEQKVSLASARAVMQRVQELCPGMSAELFLQVSEQALRDAGISARKVSYCRSIAMALHGGELDLKRLRQRSDEEVMRQLTAIRGIGPWTAGVYLLMAMRRPDAWASGDRALAVSLAECEELETVPSYADLDQRASGWQPYRAAAARLLWHAYLSRRQPRGRVRSRVVGERG